MRRFFIVGLVTFIVALVPTTASAQVAPPTAANNTLLINVSIPTDDPNFDIVASFRCTPGTVTGPGPNDFTLTDVASPFDTTMITAAAPVGAPLVSNVCTNSLTAARTQIDVTTTGSDSVGTVTPGGATVLGGLTQSAAVPPSVFVTGYNLGFLEEGVNNISANVGTKIEATNTVQGVQNTNTEGGTPPDGSVLVTTTITDPNGTPGTGDESATPGSFSVTYDDLNWTAGSSGAILYRQASIVRVPVAQDPVYVPPPPKAAKCKKGKKRNKKGKCVKKKKKKKKKK